MGKEYKDQLKKNEISESENENGDTTANGIKIKKLDKHEKEKIRKALRKKKKKLRRKNKEFDGEDISDNEENESPIKDADNQISETNDDKESKLPTEANVEVEYVERDEYLLTGKYYEEFKNVFQYFSTPKVSAATKGTEENDNQEQEAQNNQDQPTSDQQAQPPLSRKKKKLLKRLKVAQLKALVKRPDAVEVWDTTAPDPLLLVYLKSYKNSVPVPRHWCQKRKFLQNKRGILKAPFKLPENIERTGIARLRDPFNDKEAGRLIKQKLRERMNPKLGKIDIDYEILHDAFFKFQTKPRLTIHGDIYFEGREDEVKMKSYKPGRISEELRIALGISEYAPPPWIINMQRYGPPPSYPNLKIPGVNCPVPEGGHYGSMFQRPVDELGKPIMGGNIYGTMRATDYDDETAPVDKTLWGEIIEEEILDEVGQAVDLPDTTDPRTESDVRSGVSSIISGMETPETDIRKQAISNTSRIAAQQVQNINYHESAPKPLYQVLEPIQTNVGSNIYGSTHGYIIPGINDQLKNQQNLLQQTRQQDTKPQQDTSHSFKF